MEVNNIFKGANFGTKYVLSNNKYAVYIGDRSSDCYGGKHILYVPGFGECSYKSNGKAFKRSIGTPHDIISCLDNIHEIDMKKLTEYAKEQVSVFPGDTLGNIYVRAFIKGYLSSKTLYF